MRVSIGGIFAKCFACSSNDFAPSRPLERSDLLACARCCTYVAYDELLSQIGREAVARAKTANADAQLSTEVRSQE